MNQRLSQCEIQPDMNMLSFAKYTCLSKQERDLRLLGRCCTRGASLLISREIVIMCNNSKSRAADEITVNLLRSPANLSHMQSCPLE